MKYVRVVDNIVVEIIPKTATPIEKWYNASFASQCVEAPDDVEQGWYCDPDTKVFTDTVVEKSIPVSPIEQLRADVDYISVMMGVEL